jgi:choline dehydrogenase
MPREHTYDFVIVGSGAGGGPLAANLALEGFRVVLIEAGGDQINDHYSVPAFHGLSTEDPLFSWEFYVKHYGDDNRPDRDPKYHKPDPRYPGAPGIFYPRASALGGCTAHHAMITVYPHESDWDRIAKVTGDASWRAKNMRQYFDRIERAQYRDGSTLLNLLEPGQAIGGLLRRVTASDEGERARGERGAGWLPVTQADPRLLLDDVKGVLQFVAAGFHVAKQRRLDAMPGWNPNDPTVAEGNREGVNVIPISVHNGRRAGARERILEARRLLAAQAEQGQRVGRLELALHSFVTEILFADDDPRRAVGVRCVPGADLYAARHHTKAPGQPGEPVTYRAAKEVILCGGAFNTPQLLMLSGIGPKDELERHGIPIRIALPGVGRNLQDRYEVGVVARASAPFRLLRDATFTGRERPGDPDPDPAFTEWREEGAGIYATNGAVLGIVLRSSTRKRRDPPDLYLFGVPGEFRGYRIGYARDGIAVKDHFTWAVLKGHTDNTSGCVRLRSKDPFATPEIDFRCFEDSDQPYENDVQSVVDGVKLALEIYGRLKRQGVVAEVLDPPPGADLHQFVRDTAWGHHASCTCPIGADDDPMAVLDGEFRVRGAKNLRVVDASVFPRIPGLFLLTSVYMVSEKASDVIAARHGPAS